MGKQVSRKWKKAAVAGLGLIVILVLSGILFFNLSKLLNTKPASHTAVSTAGKSSSKIADRTMRARKRDKKKSYGRSKKPLRSNQLFVPKSIPVLMYHCINDKTRFANSTEQSLTIPTKVFTDQLDWLETHGYHVVSLNDAYAAMTSGKPLPSKPVVLTFDDGAPDAYTNVYPILSQRELSGAFFIIVARVDNDEGLNWAKLTEMANAGMQIESHTMTHADLPTGSPEEMVYELKQSKALIEERLGRPADFIAYPFGEVNQVVIEATKQAGYSAAFTIRPGPWQAGDNLFTLKRVRVSRGETIATFAGELGR